MSDTIKRWGWRRVLSTLLLASAGVVCMMLADVSLTVASGALFAVGLALLVIALRPHIGLALWLGGVLTLGHGHGIDQLSGWTVAFFCLTVAGPLIGLRRLPAYATMAASLPFWMLGSVIPWMTNVAPIVFMSGPVWMFWRLLVTTRRDTSDRGGTPLPELANGPLVPVEPRTFAFKRGLRALRIIALIFAAGAATGGVFALRGNIDAGALGAASGMVALSFWFAIWLNSRSRYRVDAHGISKRVFLRETTIPWRDVTDIFTGTTRIGLWATRMQYEICGVGSATREITFPHTLTGASELRAIVECATGQQFGGSTAEWTSDASTWRSNASR